MIVARNLHPRRPAWSRAKLAVLSSLPGGAIVLLLGGYFLTRVGPASAEQIDSGGMIIAGLMTLTPLYAFLVLIVGMLSSRAVLPPR
jgi:hypothetical protein